LTLWFSFDKVNGIGEVMTDHHQVEAFWDAILSREPQKILAAFRPLPALEQQQVLSHLNRMTQESGWHDQQRLSAQTALDILRNFGG
jgi:hypothetical protein